MRLEGKALEEFLRREKERKAEEAREKAEQERREREEMESSDDSDEEQVSEAANRGRHDLMVKTEGKGHGGFFRQAKKSHPMFPVKEEKIKWDEYGELIRSEDYIIKDVTPAEEEKMDTGEGEAVAAEKEQTEVPTTCVSSVESFELRANILFIDFEGRSDGDSIKKIVTQMRPRQLILVRGSPEATESLARTCRDAAAQVFTPRLMETVDATTESHIFQVRLKDSVVSALEFARARDAEIAWLDAVLELGQIGEAGGEGVAMVVPAPHAMQPHPAVFINEPKLSDFKQTLVNLGFQAEFSAGVLICNNTVAVKKNEAGRLQLEGALCDDYYRVRQLLYEQFAIV